MFPHALTLKAKFFPRVLAGALLTLICASPARAWWDGEWTERKKITLDIPAAAIPEAVSATPVLIRLHDGNFSFTAVKPDGGDLRFVAEDDKTVLAYHVEKFDPLLNEALIWVKLPDLKPGAKASIWLYYGNAGAKAVRADDPKGTYDADTVLVYHFTEHGAPAVDASGNGNNSANAGSFADDAMIGSGLRLDGKSLMTLPVSPSLAWADGGVLTWSLWFKPTALPGDAIIFSRREGRNAFVIGADKGMPYVEISGASGPQRATASAPVTVNAWHHLAVTAAGGKITLYLDGDSVATLAAALPALNSAAIIGGDSVMAAGTTGLVGEVDELQIAKVARNASFIKLAASVQGGAADKLIAFSPEELPKDWLSWLKGGYFGIIISSLTLDGWVVIGILMVMSAISWVVMLNKISYLNGLSRGNTLFMKEWGHIANDLTVLDHGDEDRTKTLGGRVDAQGMRALRSSSVYRIYQIGSSEIRHRLAADRSGKVLSARSIQAIRASLDGGIVRESQKLNRMIVLLTIAISGGPFLGLLGTVVGVMITFAAVAAAGEVNVNAIAPGIAAALLATVAGLAVAIPALFGYNYIVTRVKDATSDMHVFIDEFVTKMAEY